MPTMPDASQIQQWTDELSILSRDMQSQFETLERIAKSYDGDWSVRQFFHQDTPYQIVTINRLGGSFTIPVYFVPDTYVMEALAIYRNEPNTYPDATLSPLVLESDENRKLFNEHVMPAAYWRYRESEDFLVFLAKTEEHLTNLFSQSKKEPQNE